MKIISYKKKKTNIYELIIDNGKRIVLFDDTILKYNLLVNKDISEKILTDIMKYNSELEAYYMALKYINVKLRTKREVQNKLKTFDKVIVTAVINRLEEEGYLKEKVYISAYINDTINLKLEGPNKIKDDLRKKGFNEIDIDEFLVTINDDIWQERIRKIVEKRIKSNRSDSGLFLKYKIIKELITKGYNENVYNNVLSEIAFHDDELIYQKEYNKLLKKYESSLDEDSLELKVKQSLYKKGFRK